MLISYEKVSLDNLSSDFQPARWLNTPPPVPGYVGPDCFGDLQEQIESCVSQLLIEKPFLSPSAAYVGQLQFQAFVDQLSSAVMELLETNRKAIGLPI